MLHGSCITDWIRRALFKGENLSDPCFTNAQTVFSYNLLSHILKQILKFLTILVVSTLLILFFSNLNMKSPARCKIVRL